MLEELTQEIKKQALELYKGFKEEIEPLLCEKDRDKIEENIFWKARHINSYEIMDTFSDEFLSISVITDNTEDDTLQGIMCYIELDNVGNPFKISKYIDVYLCNDDYPFEDVEIEIEV